MRLHVPFVAHNIKAELQTFWAMGLDPVLPQSWCTYVTARALSLGRSKVGFGLEAQCSAYGITHPFAASKSALQQSFLAHAEGKPFTDQQVQYALSDAETTLQLYLAQQEPVLSAGLHCQLLSVEFPFAQANARMEWDGVQIDRDAAEELRLGLKQAMDYHAAALADVGLKNPNSPQQVLSFLDKRGHGSRLARNGKPSTADDVLQGIEGIDPTVTDIRRFRQYARLVASPLLLGRHTGADGRVHPRHGHLQADTGRSTCSAPNVVGVSKTFRPLVTASKGRCIFEADFSQIEVGITAAEYHDPALIDAFNSGDVYAGVAMKMFADELTVEERAMDTTAFKAARADLRDKAKVFVLATIYGMSERTIADQFGFEAQQARALRDSFFATFPALQEVANSAGVEGQIRGFAPIVGGLRRAVPDNFKARNRHMNTPVQGSAGVIFRQATADVYAAFRGTSAKLILPVHDALVVECDGADLEWAKETTVALMSAAVRAYFPALKPRIDVNAEDTSCWNKDGRGDSIECFLKDPSFKL